MRRFFPVLIVLLSMLWIAPFAAAQDDPVVGVVSIASFDDLMKNADLLGEIVGQPLRPMIEGQINNMTAGKGLTGLDKNRPIVVAIKLGEGRPYGIICVPVSDVKQLLSITPFGETEDVGDGVLRLSNAPKPTYLKNKNNWAMLAEEKDQLSAVPDNPQELVGDLPTAYVVAIRGFVQNAPQEQRDKPLGLLGMMSQMGLQGRSDEELELGQNLIDRQMAATSQWLNDTDEITVGLGIDEETKSTHLDFSCTAVTGSKTALGYTRFAKRASGHAGFQRDDAAISVVATAHGKKSEDEIALLDAQHASSKSSAISQIDGDDDIPDDLKEDIKTALGQLIDVAFATLKADTMEIGMAVLLDDKSTIVLGGRVEDGNTMEAAIRKLVEIVGSEEELPPIQWDAETHGNLRFHVVNMPVPDNDAQALIGDQLEVVLACGENSCYLAVGGDSIGELKKTIDAAAAKAQQEIDPLQVSIRLKSILTEFASHDPSGIAGQSAETLTEDGEILITTEPIRNGMLTRIRIPKEVIAAISQAASSQMAPEPATEVAIP